MSAAVKPRKRTHVEIVDDALDKYVAAWERRKGTAPEGVQAKTLAHLAKVPVERMSFYLQEHRIAQRKQRTRYVLAAEGYGRRGPSGGSRWLILARPGQDPIEVRDARVEHAKWVGRDMAARLARDIVTEVAPGLQGTARDRLIEATMQHLSANADAAVAFVESTLVSA